MISRLCIGWFFFRAMSQYSLHGVTLWSSPHARCCEQPQCARVTQLVSMCGYSGLPLAEVSPHFQLCSSRALKRNQHPACRDTICLTIVANMGESNDKGHSSPLSSPDCRLKILFVGDLGKIFPDPEEKKSFLHFYGRRRENQSPRLVHNQWLPKRIRRHCRRRVQR